MEITLAIAGPLTRQDLPGLTRRVRELLERTGATGLTCDLAGLEADAVAVDALARIALAARRAGAQLIVTRASGDLLSLIAFMGLDCAVGEGQALRCRGRGEAEPPGGG
jgi:ABC-type transporter Mla MlaB component